MDYKSAITYLQPIFDNTPKVGYGEALGVALNALREIEQLKEDLRNTSDRCKFCLRMSEPLACLGSDYTCHECFQRVCGCRDCQKGSNWEWRGVPEGGNK